MRHTSDGLRSSNIATSLTAFFSSSDTRMVTSQIFFSLISFQAKKSRRWRVARPGCEDPAADAGRRETRLAVQRMSGGLLFLFCGKHIRSQQLQVHQARIWNAVFTPLRYCAFRDIAQAGDYDSPA